MGGTAEIGSRYCGCGCPFLFVVMVPAFGVFLQQWHDIPGQTIKTHHSTFRKLMVFKKFPLKNDHSTENDCFTVFWCHEKGRREP